LLGRRDVGNLPAEFVERHPQLLAGEVGAEAEVRSRRHRIELRLSAACSTECHPRISPRLAEEYQIVTLSPALILAPLSSVSWVSVRRMYDTGDVQRKISSTAEYVRSRHSSGCS
jgi:hypothetical protein